MLMKKVSALGLLSLAAMQQVLAQGAAGIDAASSEIGTYFDPVDGLILTIAAIVALVGGCVVFIRWQSKSSNNIPGEILGWAGGCIFVLLIGVFVKAVFGL